MEYYYCPGLLKLLQYLWVSALLDRGIFFGSSSLAFPLQGGSSASVFSEKQWWLQGEGMLGKGQGAL